MGDRGRSTREGGSPEQREASRLVLPIAALVAVLYAFGFGAWSALSAKLSLVNGTALAITATLGLGVLLTHGRRGHAKDGEKRNGRRSPVPRIELATALIALAVALVPLFGWLQGTGDGPTDVKVPTYLPCQKQAAPKIPFSRPAETDS
jgi:hypothetical protein